MNHLPNGDTHLSVNKGINSDSDRDTSLLRADNLGFTRSGRPIFQQLSLSFYAGECIGLLGANGGGKSTLLRTLAGFIHPSRGTVALAGQLLTTLKPAAIARRLAYIPQRSHFAFPYSVRRIVEMGCLPHGGSASSHQNTDAVDSALHMMGLNELAERKVTTLSGGEQQRVVIARAFAQQTPILLLDEPMTGLDYGFQLKLLALLKQSCAEGRLVIMTSHRPEELFNQADRIVILEGGTITDDGAPHDILTADRLSQLYNVPLSQVEYSAGRTFHLRN